MPRLSAEYPRFNVSTFASPTACSIPRSRPRSLQRSLLASAAGGARARSDGQRSRSGAGRGATEHRADRLTRARRRGWPRSRRRSWPSATRLLAVRACVDRKPLRAPRRAACPWRPPARTRGESGSLDGGVPGAEVVLHRGRAGPVALAKAGQLLGSPPRHRRAPVVRARWLAVAAGPAGGSRNDLRAVPLGLVPLLAALAALGEAAYPVRGLAAAVAAAALVAPLAGRFLRAVGVSQEGVDLGAQCPSPPRSGGRSAPSCRGARPPWRPCPSRVVSVAPFTS